MTLPHNGIKYPRMTEMLSEADNPSFGLMPWVGKCAVKWIKENCKCEDQPGYCVIDEELEEAKTHYKIISQEALDVGSEVHRLIEEFLNEQTRS